MSPYVRKSKTASGATQVQIAEKRNGRRRIVEHIGSAHDEAELAVLVNVANQRLHGVQPDMLPLEPAERAQGPVVERSSATMLWSVLTGAYRRLGFDHIDDEVFALLVGAPADRADLEGRHDPSLVRARAAGTAPHSTTVCDAASSGTTAPRSPLPAGSTSPPLGR